MNQFRVFLPTDDVLWPFTGKLHASWRKIMVDKSAEKLIERLGEKLAFRALAVVLTAFFGISGVFGTYIWNDITSRLKELDVKLVLIKSTVDEHERSLLTIRQFLKVSNPELSKSFFSSVEKIKELDTREFALLKGVLKLTTGDDAQPLETVPAEMRKKIERIKEEHDIGEKDLNNYRVIGPASLVELRQPRATGNEML